MKSLIISIIGWVALLTSSFNPAPSPQILPEIEAIKTEICYLQDKVYKLELDNSVLRDSVQTLAISKPFSKKWYKNFEKVASATRFVGSSNVLIASGNRVDPYIDPRLYFALSEYDGPPISLTSMRRRHSVGSHHQYGRAVDIQWNENAQLFIYWTQDTEEGKKWLDKHKLEFFCENLSWGDRQEFSKFYRHIPWATGAHIHLQLK